MTAAQPALIANLAVEVAPIRVNLIAAGFVDTALSASLLGDNLEARRKELRETLPIGRVVGPDDVAALAVHIMVNTARPWGSLAHSLARQVPPRDRRSGCFILYVIVWKGSRNPAMTVFAIMVARYNRFCLK